MTAADLAHELGAHDSSNGSGWMARCPAHDDQSPSLSISETQDGMTLVHCHAGCPQDSVISKLVDMGLWQPNRRGITCEQLAVAKQLPPELLQAAGWRDVNYQDQPAIQIPYHDRKRRVIATQFRLAMKGADRFRFKRGDTTKHLYGLESWRPKEITLLVEGATDTLTARHHNNNCIGVASAGGWDETFVPLFKECDGIFAVIESDDGGQKFYASLAKSKVRDKVRILRMPEGIKDLNDLHCADPAQFNERLQALMLKAEPIESGVVLIAVQDVEKKPLEWLARPDIPANKITSVAGDPGLGKSLLILDLIASVTAEPRFPWVDAQDGEVILLSAEDDIADTIRPRLEAAGADLSRVLMLTAVRSYDDAGNALRRGFNIVRDVERLAEALRMRNGRVRLVAVDPISAYMAGVDSHVNSAVREAFVPLAEIAAQHRTAVVIVSHLNKGGGTGGGNALYRVSGSLAFTAAARAVFAVAQDEADPQRRLLLPLKQNLAKTSEGYAYRVIEKNGAPVLEWEQARVTVTANEALTGTKEHRDAEVDEWLTERLASGHKFATSMWEEATSLHFSENRVKRARKRLGVIATKELRENGFAGWAWSLPGPAARRPSKNTGPLGRLGPLGPLGPAEEGQEGQEGQEVQKEVSRTFTLSEEMNRRTAEGDADAL